MHSQINNFSISNYPLLFVKCFSYQIFLRDFSFYSISTDSNSTFHFLLVTMLPAYTIFELIPATPILKLYGLLLDKFVHVAYFVWLYTHYSKYLILLFIWSARKDSNLHMFPYKRNSLNRWRTCGYLSPDSLYDIWKTLDLTYNLSMTWLLRTRNLQLRNSQILLYKPGLRIVVRR